MEKEAMLLMENHPELVPITSIAISLKRIADAVCGDDSHLSLPNALCEAITSGIITARNMG